MQARRILLTIAGVAGLAAAFGSNAGAQSGPQGLRASVMPAQHLSITINVAGAGHGEHVTVPTFAVEPGLPVRLTFTNRTQQMHTFTIPGLGVSAIIAAAHGTTPTKTVVTFTAHQHGAFSWACLLCPGHGGGAGETMKGTVYAIVQV
jgi:heme/copper-type cytochrome/quinol oxidase subunit 2